MEKNDVWTKNAAVITKLFPGLAEQIDAATPPVALRLETAADGEPTLVVNGVYVHSKREPAREGARLARAVVGSGDGGGAASVASYGVIVALGFGLGYAVAAVAEQCGNSHPIIIVEKHPEILKKAFETRDFTNFLSKNIIVFALGDADSGVAGVAGAEAAVFGALSFFNEKKDARILKNRALVQLDEAWYAGIERRIHTWQTKDAVNEATAKRFGDRWTRNFLKNCAISDCVCAYPGVSRLKGLLKRDIPLLLVAAGPSLDDVAALLPAFAERCAVVGVDTSLNYLLRSGVDPDWIVSGDPQYWNSRHLDRLGVSSACLVTESAIYPRTLRRAKRVFLFATPLPFGKQIEEKVDPKGRLGSGGSVATTAFDLCLELDPSVIFIAGLDLSFPHFKTHFKDAFFEKQANAQAARLCPAETCSFRALRDGSPFYARAANGGKTLTDKRLSLYAAWFENRLFSMRSARSRPMPSVYSLSEEGLAINGLRTARAGDILALPPREAEMRLFLQSAFDKIEQDFAAEIAERTRRWASIAAAIGGHV
ncbi:MAG: DUF115 domain-containing protein [Treponema sp.]|jgi:hypothetical protein|nr:DUF115 domain-containing protein [Treponema sp.]